MSVLTLLLKNWKLGLAGIFALGFMTQTVRIEGFWFIVGYKDQITVLRIDLGEARAATAAEIAKHAATKAAYRAAQEEAERMENERLVRITARQKEITNDALAAFNRRRAADRAALERLRAHLGRTGPAGGTPGVEVQGLPASATGATDPAEGLSLDEQSRVVTQLDALIGWNLRQSQVDPSK